MEPKVESQEPQYDEELLLKWDDHHKSFFELAEDLCHQVKTRVQCSNALALILKTFCYPLVEK
jgi:hypothetical protein